MRLHGLAVLALHPGMAMAYAVYALEEVEAQIQSYVDRNGTHTAQNSQPSGCALAVRTS